MSTATQLLASLHRELGIPSDYAGTRGLEPYFDAPEAELIEVGRNDEDRPIRLLPMAAEAWHRMRDAAAHDGHTLIPISGFRSIARQTEIIRAKLAAGQDMASILRYVAAPGYSEHHSARAIDIGSPEHIELDEDFARTAAYGWLAKNAGRFGFVMSYPRDNPYGIGYEPWHWCWHREISGGA